MNMKRLNIRILFIICAIVLFAISCSDSSDNGEKKEPGGDNIKFPNKELRAAWLATVWNLDLPLIEGRNIEAHKQAYLDLLDIYKQHKMNAVFVQIRPKADAFYRSKYEPWSSWLTGTLGKDPGYDVLDFMLKETHKRGIEFHAWINPYAITTDNTTFKPTPGHVVTEHPEWVMKYGKQLMFRPSHPDVPPYLVKVIDDILANYAVDGIHFDDYFYPYPIEGETLDDLGDFQKYGKDYKNIEDFRRGCVNTAVQKVHELISQKYPSVLFSISPYAVWRNKSKDPNGSQTSSLSCYDELYADARLWCEKSWIDFIIPQLYQGTNKGTGNNYAPFETLTAWWSKNTFNTPLMIGYPLYRFNSNDANDNPNGSFNNTEFEYELRYAMAESKIQGAVYYNSSAMKYDRGNIMKVMDKYYTAQAVIPYMGRSTEDKPNKPDILLKNQTIEWKAEKKGVRYVIYKIRNKEAQVLDITSDTVYSLNETADYCVTTLNKDNQESEVSNVVSFKKQ